jgi:hypothetical protein
MGIFDAIGSIFTGGNNISGPGGAGLQLGYNLGMPQLQAGLGNVGQLISGQAVPYLQSQYQAALPYMQGVYDVGATGVSDLKKLLGLGPGGSAGALNALQNTPGYQFNLRQGDAARVAQDAASGQLGSGNEAIALSNYNQGLAQNTFQNAVSNLSPFTQMFQSGASGVGNLFSGLGTNVANLFTTQSGQQSPFYNAMANMGWNLGAGTGVYGAQQGMLDTVLGGNIVSGLMNLGGKLWPSFPSLSDVRAKEDIAPVGKMFDGQNVYKFRYKGDSTPRIGLLAQEVEREFPEAVREIGGLKHVDYAKATAPSSAIAHLMAA